MKIEDKLTESILNGIKTLYNQEVPAKMVQLQKTKKEFEGEHLLAAVGTRNAQRRMADAERQGSV